MSFKDKVVIITGGSAGIGAATAEQFAKEGANVAIVGRNEARLKEVAQRCEKLGAATLVIKADVAKDEEAKTIVKKTVEMFGKLDIFVNNAAIFKHVTLSSPDLLKTYDEVTNINIRAVVHLTSLAAPYLAKSKGNIINISSILGTHVQSPEFMIYCLSKAALNHFTRSAALELAASGVRVNIVSPGPVRTDMLEIVDPTKRSDDYASMTALHRVSEAEEIADMILFLASDKAKGVTGSTFGVDNGSPLKY